ncbi:MAG: hypothetical protein AAGE80_16620 [Pseudomonadota bacterium]
MKSIWTRAGRLAVFPALFFLPSQVFAEDICAALDRMVDVALERGSEASASIGDAEACGVALQADGKAPYCYWSFPLRAQEARSAFSRLESDLRTCLGSGLPYLPDQDVNHPDSYTAGSFQTNEAEIAISLKDKAALNQTLVFLRVGQRPKTD